MARLSSVDTIRKQIRELEKKAQRLERGATKGIRAAAKVISKYSLTLSDLKAALNGGGGRRSALAGRSVPPKYRDFSGNTWTGRGRPPLWLVAAEKSGKKRELFLIERPKKAANSKVKAKIVESKAKVRSKAKSKRAVAPKGPAAASASA